MKPTVTLAILIALVSTPCLTACSYMDKGRAQQSGWQEQRFNQVRDGYVGDDAPDDMIAAITDKDERNEMIEDVGYLIDYQFEEFVNSLHTDRALFDSVADITVLSLTTTAAIISPESTKSILSALAAITTGSQASIDENFFHKQAIAALSSQMRATRNDKWAKIVTKMQQDLNAYSARHALIDLIDYYNSGSLLQALEVVTKNTRQRQEESEEARRATITLAFNASLDVTELQQAIADWLKQDVENFNKIKAWLIENQASFGVAMPEPSIWVYNAPLSQLNAAIQKFSIPVP